MKRWFRPLAALAVVGLVIAALAEAALRLNPSYLPAESAFSLFERAMDRNQPRAVPHEHLGYVWEPNLEGWIGAPEFGFTFAFETDERGFRNPWPWPEEADIVVVGDSEGFGYGVDDGATWSDVLGEQTGNEVVNLALIGGSPQQAVRAYEVYGAPLDPDLVLVGLYPPNAMYAGRLYADWVAEGRPDRLEVRRSGEWPPPGPEGIKARIKHLVSQSYLVRSLYDTARGVLGRGTHIETIEYADGPLRLFPEQLENAAAETASGGANFQLVLESLVELRNRVQRDGSQLVAVLFPTKEEIHLPLLGEAAPEVLPPFLEAFEEAGIAYVDLTAALRERAEQGERLFYALDLHPNAAGYRVIGEVLAERLEPRLDAPSASAGVLRDRESGAAGVN